MCERKIERENEKQRRERNCHSCLSRRRRMSCRHGQNGVRQERQERANGDRRQFSADGKLIVHRTQHPCQKQENCRHDHHEERCTSVYASQAIKARAQIANFVHGSARGIGERQNDNQNAKKEHTSEIIDDQVGFPDISAQCIQTLSRFCVGGLRIHVRQEIDGF